MQENLTPFSTSSPPGQRTRASWGRTRLLAMLLLLLASSASISSALAQCMLYPVSLPDRTQAAVLVVEGKVSSRLPFWNAEHTMIHTANVIDVYKVLKGSFSGTQLVVITDGGTVGLDRVVVEPSLQLNLGETGVLFLAPNTTSGYNTPLAKYQPESDAQGFVLYDAKDPTRATDPFALYTDLPNQLFNVIEQNAGMQPRIIQAVPVNGTNLKGGGMTTFAAPIISNFSPTTVNAGHGDILTINGSNFGTNTDSAKVEFRNADTGGSTYTKADPLHIVSWSNTQIQIQVPTRAGTGTIRVTNNGNEVGTSATNLTVTFNRTNLINGGFIIQPKLVNRNSNGGYTFTFNTDFEANTPAKEAFIRALETWRCNTGVNIDIDFDNTSAITAAGNDGVNIVTIGTLPNGVLGRASTFYSGCGSNPIVFYVNGIDHVYTNDAGIDWNFGPGNPAFTQYDFESVAVHEMGHTHQLGHIIAPGNVMHYSISNNAVQRTLNPAADIGGGDAVMTHSLTGGICSQPVHQEVAPAACLLGCALSASVNSTNATTCTNGSITISSPSGATNYEYSIDGGTTWQTSGSFTGLSAATYNVMMRDADDTGCEEVLNASLALTGPAPVTIPDANFRSFLVNNFPSVMNVSQQLLPCEAALITGTIDCAGWGIANLTGIEYFTSLTHLSCYSNQLTGLPALPSSLTDLECYSNQLTSLPALPPGLGFLSCSENQLTSLPALPSGIYFLSCGLNQLTSLPTLPSDLDQLLCANNQLSSLPALSSTLTYLNCAGNQLTTLPALPNSLQHLRCQNNLLSSLPTLPNSLCFLYCTGNSITCLPNLPTCPTFYSSCGMTVCCNLSASVNSTNATTCTNGSITISSPSGATNYEYSIDGGTTWQTSGSFTGLSAATYNVMMRDADNTTCEQVLNASLALSGPGPVTIPDANFRSFLVNNYPSVMNVSQQLLPCEAAQVTGMMDCSFLGIADLSGIELFTSLEQLSCQGNNLTNLPLMPASLKIIRCEGNPFLTAIASLPASLEELYCFETALATLPALPAGLVRLDCYNNTMLTSLPALPNSLVYLECSNSQLSSLPALPASLTDLWCNNNQLSSLPALPASLTWLNCSNNQLLNLPTLPNSLCFLSAMGNSINCLPNLPTCPTFNSDIGSNLCCSLSASVLTSEPNTCFPNGEISIVSPSGAFNYEYSINGGQSWWTDGTFTGLGNGTYVVMMRDADNPSCEEVLFDSLVFYNFSTLDPVYIPNANFRAFLMSNYPHIMTGGGHLHTCLAADVTGTMNVSSLNISNLSGIEYFSSLDTLVCFENPLTTVDSLPIGLKHLAIADCPSLSSLPTLPVDLQSLYCVSNMTLTSLPALPSSLTHLFAIENNLISLPALPASLSIMEVGGNQLTTLPALPANLLYLTCIKGVSNSLTALPALPEGLDYLDVTNNNDLTELPTLPNSLCVLKAVGTSVFCLPNLPTCATFTSDIGTALCCPTITASNVNVTAATCGLNNGVITIDAPTGGQSPYEFSIDGGTSWQFSSSFPALNIGSYTIRVRDDNGCENDLPSGPYVVNNLGNAPSITLEPSDTLVDEFLPVSFSSAASDATSYQWQLSTDGGTSWNDLTDGGAISGATTTTLNISAALAEFDGYVYRMVASGTCTPDAISYAAVLTVSPFICPTITASVGITNPFCGASDGQLSVGTPSGGQAPYEFSIDTGATWHVSGTFSNLAPGAYAILVKDANDCENNLPSGPYVLDDQGTAPSFVEHPSNESVNAGDPANFTASAPDATGYQWQVSTDGGSSWSNITDGGIYSGATSPSLDISDATGLDGNQYRAVASGICPPNATSFAGILTVTPACGTITASVGITNPFCGASDGQLSVGTPSGGQAPYEFSIDTGATWHVSGTFSNLAPGAYAILVKDANDCENNLPSGPYVLTNQGAAPSIFGHPSNVSVNAGDPASFSVTASDATGYQWQVSTDGGSSWSNITNSGVYSGATTPSLSISDATGLDGNQYRAVASGICPPNATSNPALLTVTPACGTITASVGITNPFCGASDGQLSVGTPSGGQAPYEFSIDDGTSWQTSGDFMGLSQGSYTIRVRDDNGCENDLPSGPYVLTNQGAAPSIFGHPSNVSVNAGDPASFSVTASDATGYQWYVSTDGGSSWVYATGGVYSGANSATLNISDATGLDGNQYNVVVSGTCPPDQTSAAATLSVTIPSCLLSGTVTVPGTYASLTAAAADIAAKGVNGTLTVEITDAYTGAGEVYPIELGSFGCGAVHVTRAANATVVKTIQSNNADATIRVSGSNWSFDGRSAGRGNSIYLLVNNTGASSGAAMEIAGSLQNVSVSYLNFRASDTASIGGVVRVWGASPNGCDNVTFQNCKMFNMNTTTLPANGLYVGGNGGNDNLTLQTNELYNTSSTGILVAPTGNGDGFVLSNNSVYSTLTLSSVWVGIDFRPTTSGNHTITGNFVGGQRNNGGLVNVPMQNSAAGLHIGIRVVANTAIAGGTPADLVITNNTVRNINLSNTGAALTGPVFYGIWVGGGAANQGSLQLTGNTVGNETNAGFGINVALNGAGYGIVVDNGFQSPINVSGNTIGHISMNGTANNRTRARVFGIVVGGERNNTQITNNKVANLSVANSRTTFALGNGPLLNSAAAGIVFVPRFNTTGHNISGNTLSGLSHHTTVTNWTLGQQPTSAVTGISVAAASVGNLSQATTVSSNRIYDLVNSGNTAATRQLIGIEIWAGDGSQYINNMMSLSNGANTNSVNLVGFLDVNGQGRTAAIYHNSVYLSGSTSGDGYSAAYHRLVETAIDLKNNVLLNDRTTTGSGWQVAIASTCNIGGNPNANWAAGASDYNVLSAVNPAQGLAWSDSPTTLHNLADWNTITGGDRSSWLYASADLALGNLFIDVATANLRIKNNNPIVWTVNGKAVALPAAGITTDVNGVARNTTLGYGSDIGACEVVPTSLGLNPVTISQNITGPGVYNFVLGSRTLASINVTTQGSLTAMGLQYYSNAAPSFVDVPGYAETKADGYYRLTATAGAINYTFNATLDYDPGLLGDISSEADLMFSHGNVTCKTWAAYLPTTTPIISNVNTTTRTVTLVALKRDGFFVASDVDQPLVHPFQKPIGALTTNTAAVNFSGETLVATSTYRIEYRVVGAPTFTTTGVIPACVSPNCSFTLTGLAANTTYEWRIRNSCFGTGGPLQTFTTPASKAGDVSAEVSLNANLVVFPNPATSFVNISLDNVADGDVTLALFDIMGREVINTTLQTQDGYLQHSLPLEGLAQGLYVIKLTGQNLSLTHNLMIAK